MVSADALFVPALGSAPKLVVSGESEPRQVKAHRGEQRTGTGLVDREEMEGIVMVVPRLYE
jgi:hypothetical protein